MNISIFSIFDKKVSAYRPPFTGRNPGEVKRMVQSTLQSQNQLSEYPADFDIYYLGEMNDVSGQIDGIKPEFICSVISLMPADRAGSERAPALKSAEVEK